MVSEKRPIMARPSLPDHDGVVALVITADESGRLFMTAALEASQRRLRLAKDGIEARKVPATDSIPVVIMDGDAQAPSWSELLEQISVVEGALSPKFIVVSRLRDDTMWAEVLNLGGYDLLPKPLEADQVSWVVRSALSGWNGAL